jgi:hypothetical protein
MLDTVRITAARVTDRQDSGFDTRRRSGLGQYLTGEDLARRGAVVTSDVFRNMAGVRVDGTGLSRQILVRSAFGDHCAPAVYIDGMYMWTLSADELDGMVTPPRIRGIEVYNEATTPVEYQRSLSGCGVILIWTK